MLGDLIPKDPFEKIDPQPPPNGVDEFRPQHPHFQLEDCPKLPTFPFPDHVRDRLLFMAVDRLLWGYKTPKIIAQISELTGIRLSKNQVFDLLRYAFRTHQLLGLPPRHHVLARDMARFSNFGDIQVVPDREGLVTNPVAEAGAQVVHGLIHQVAARKEGPVHIAFGIGHSTRLLAAALARMVSADLKGPELVVHSLTPVYSVYDPTETPLFFFSYFQKGNHQKAKFVGMFTEPVADAASYSHTIDSAVVREAFDRRDEIDIVITSLASSRDKHGHLYQYLERFGRSCTPEKLRREGWVGDLHLRPYSETGPMEISEGMKPITLFELADLTALARRPDKHVVLLCSPCSTCHEPKNHALLPLLTSPGLHVWDHLLIDQETAARVSATPTPVRSPDPGACCLQS